MRISLFKRISAGLLCCCTLFASGCFPVYSIVGKEEYNYYGASGSLDLEVTMSDQKQVVSGEYPDGTRAFIFKNCTYEADISDFSLIDLCGNVSLYYYTGVTVLNDKPDENGNTENKKGYYDPADSSLKFRYFWTVAGYNFVTGEYFEIESQKYDPVKDAGKMNGNPVVVYKGVSETTYLINVGYSFILFSLKSPVESGSSDGSGTNPSSPIRIPRPGIVMTSSITNRELDYIKTSSSAGTLDKNDYKLSSKKTWKFDGDNKESISKYLGIKGSSDKFCCTDIAVKNNSDPNDLKFAASFMKLPDDESSYDQDNVMMEVRLQTDGDGQRSIKLHKKQKGLQTVRGGNILSSNYTAGNCVYVLEEKDDKIKFGIDNRDRKTDFKVSLDKNAGKDGNNVLQSFSVKDWVYWYNGARLVSNEQSVLELVFKNRIAYYKIQRKSGTLGVIEYDAVHIRTFSISDFCSNYLSSDDIPSIGYKSSGVLRLASTTEGFLRIYSSGKIASSSVKGADFCSFDYGNNIAVIGFNEFTFDKTVRYFDKNGKETSVSKSKSEFTLAQLPFATIRII